MPGTWQAQPIVVDGDSKDWPSPYPNYDAKAMVAYATSNDKKNLYITMETGDNMTQMKVLKQGAVVSIDTNGGKDPQFSINYPLQNDNESMGLTKADYPAKKGESHSLERKMEERISKNAENANQLSLEGFKECNGGFMVSQNNHCGIKVIARVDEYKELVWEAVIPFKAIYGKDSISEADAGKPISVCFAVKGFKRPESKSSESGSTNMNSGMGGGMRGAAMGGGGRGGTRPSDNPMEHLYENTKTWKFFSLAYQR